MTIMIIIGPPAALSENPSRPMCRIVVKTRPAHIALIPNPKEQTTEVSTDPLFSARTDVVSVHKGGGGGGTRLELGGNLSLGRAQRGDWGHVVTKG